MMKSFKLFLQTLFQPGYIVIMLCVAVLLLITCGRYTQAEHELVNELRILGLDPEVISTEDFLLGKAPMGFAELTGAPYKPSYNEEPNIPPQCWIETGYGTQNACKYCHTDYLSSMGHGNAFPIGYQQILYNFPTPGLNRILWRNIIFPQEIDERLQAEGIAIPDIDDIDYVRQDNWRPAYAKARGNGNTEWVNTAEMDSPWAFFPALDPNHLYPYQPSNPTSGGLHGYIDQEGFVKDSDDKYTGWRAINFFPYTLFTPITGSVSGIYIRLPDYYMTDNGNLDIPTYKKNLAILEQNIKNQHPADKTYAGDASHVDVKPGFYPVGTEFAHPLHYVDLAADGKMGRALDAVSGTIGVDYAFPGTRSKRVKEIRYMYKWKEVELDDIAMEDEEHEHAHAHEEYGEIVGREGQGWVDNEGGWILSAYIEDRFGELRPQTTEELAQCIGCHANVGNTIDAVWSFQRKLPEEDGWRDMDYGRYNASRPGQSSLKDYLHEGSGMGELGYFYYTVVGADLYGVMPADIKEEIIRFTNQSKPDIALGLMFPVELLFDDEQLKNLGRNERKSILTERQKLMRQFVADGEYLRYSQADDTYYIKGNLLYPGQQTMKNNIRMYRKIVLDQSFNLGKDVFGSEAEHVPFTFRSDGTVLDEYRYTIPVGQVIMSRPYDEEGVGYTPTGLVAVNEDGDPIDENGKAVGTDWSRAVGHISKGGTFDMMYNSILSDKPFRPSK